MKTDFNTWTGSEKIAAEIWKRAPKDGLFAIAFAVLMVRDQLFEIDTKLGVIADSFAEPEDE